MAAPKPRYSNSSHSLSRCLWALLLPATWVAFTAASQKAAHVLISLVDGSQDSNPCPHCNHQGEDWQDLSLPGSVP